MVSPFLKFIYYLSDPNSALTLSDDMVMVMMDEMQINHCFFRFACKDTAFAINLPNNLPKK